MDYEVQKGDCIAQLIEERIDNQEWKEVEVLEETEQAGKGFGSTGIGLELKETQPTICFLHSNGNHQCFDTADTYQHPIFH